MKQPLLFPQVQKISAHTHAHFRRARCRILVPESYSAVFVAACSVCGDNTLQRGNAGAFDVQMRKIQGLSREEYRIFVRETGIELLFSERVGAFYALITLWQLYTAYSGALPCLEIKDAPALPIRGVLLDVSRGKVPKMATLKQLVDTMARCKLNHLQLYIEGVSFAYPAYEQLWRGETPITPAEIRELDSYCRERFVELVPCQNALGHMTRWLQEPCCNALAECKDGFTVMGKHFPPTTIDVCNPKGIAFVEGLFDALLPHFTSSLCNACLDEPFEMCMGENKARQNQKYSLYADYAARLCGYFRSKNKRMMMWGDVLARDSTILSQLPQDILLLDWGYEAEHPVEVRAAALAQSGHDFCLCPGTNSWLSFTGLSDNMYRCIQRTAQAAYQFQASGIIVTDWGDMGHLQYLPVSWQGILTTAAFAWNREGADERMLADALDAYVFQDANGVMGQLCFDAGRYVDYEEFRLPCRTLAMTVYTAALPTQADYERQLEELVKSAAYFLPECVYQPYFASYQARKPLNAAHLTAYLDTLSRRLGEADLQCRDCEIVLREYKNALSFVKLLTELRQGIYSGRLPENIQAELSAVVEEHRTLWHIRNKAYGCEAGIAPLVQMQRSL